MQNGGSLDVDDGEDLYLLVIHISNPPSGVTGIINVVGGSSPCVACPMGEKGLI